MFNKLKNYFNSLTVDTMEQDYERIKKNPSTLEKAIQENNVEDFLTSVEQVHTNKQRRAREQEERNNMFKDDEYVAPKKQAKTKSLNNMYTREFVRNNVDSDLAKMMTLMSKPARDYKIKKTIAQKLFK